MRVCVVSFKDCWQDAEGRWMSYGGFPLQMAAVGSMFDEMTLVIVRAKPRAGGIALPPHAQVVALREPSGVDGTRKLSLLAQLPYYVSTIVPHVRRADVVHAPVPGDISFLGMLLALLLRKRTLARYGSSWVTTKQTTTMNRVIRGCMRLCAGGRNVMLATGDGSTPPGRRMAWIFSTALSRAELDRIQPVLDRELSTPPRLVYIGRLSPEKGVRFLLRALAQLQEQAFTPLPRLLVLGDGPERAALEAEAASLGCVGLVTFAGHLDREGLAAHLGAQDVCVQPSLTEGFSKAWLDAMAYGLPVLTTRVGAAEAVIGAPGERGWLVPPGDVDALAAALRALSSPEIVWPSLRRRCRTYVESRTLEAWAARLGELCAGQWNWTLHAGKLRA